MMEETYTIFLENKEVGTGFTRENALLFVRALFMHHATNDTLTIQITREWRPIQRESEDLYDSKSI